MFTNTALLDEVETWRRHLHTIPETGFEERQTSDFVAQKLLSFGLEVHRGIGGTGVVGVLRCGNAKRAIGFRADMDALNIVEANDFAHRSGTPGKMHACGHDGHTAMLLGAASALSAERKFDGTIHFIFQPAEEHGRGARAMLDDGLLRRFPFSEVYGLHNDPQQKLGTFATRVGALLASEDNFEITIRGIGGHASRPHHVRDPIVAGAQIIMGLQSIVSRKLSPLESGVVSVTEIVTDGTRNVIPSTVVIRGDTRSFSPEVQSVIKTTMQRIAEGICVAAGVEHSFSYTHEFVPVMTTAAATHAAVQAAAQVFDSVDSDCEPLTASEDFAHLLKACGNGNFALIGNAPRNGQPGTNLHHPHYDFNDEAITYGVRYWVALARQQLPVAA